MPQPFDSSDIPVVTHHQQGDYMTTEMPYKPNDYTLHPMSMSVLGISNDPLIIIRRQFLNLFFLMQNALDVLPSLNDTSKAFHHRGKTEKTKHNE